MQSKLKRFIELFSFKQFNNLVKLYQTSYFLIDFSKINNDDAYKDYPCDCLFVISENTPIPLSLFKQISLLGKDDYAFVYFNLKNNSYDKNYPKDLVFILQKQIKKQE